MGENFIRKGYTGNSLIQVILKELDTILQRHDKIITNYNLPKLLTEVKSEIPSKTLLKEINYEISEEELAKVNTLTNIQWVIFEEIMMCVDKKNMVFIFWMVLWGAVKYTSTIVSSFMFENMV